MNFCHFRLCKRHILISCCPSSIPHILNHLHNRKLQSRPLLHSSNSLHIDSSSTCLIPLTIAIYGYPNLPADYSSSFQRIFTLCPTSSWFPFHSSHLLSITPKRSCLMDNNTFFHIPPSCRF